MADAAAAASRGDHRLVLGIGLFFLLMGALGFAAGLGGHLRDRAIVEAGLTAQAQVTRKYTSFVADEGDEYHVRYRFSVPDGRVFDAQYSLAKAPWKALRVGDTLTVFYAGDNPRRSFPVGRGMLSTGLVLFVCGICAVLASFGGLLVVAGTRGLLGRTG